MALASFGSRVVSDAVKVGGAPWSRTGRDPAPGSSGEEGERLGHREEEQVSRGPGQREDGDPGVLFMTQGTPQIAANTRSRERQEGFSPEPREGAWPCLTLVSHRELRTVRAYVLAVASHPHWSASLQGSEETNALLNLHFGWGGPGPFHCPENLGSESHTIGFTDTLGCHYSERDLTGSSVELCGPRTLAPLVKTVGPFGQVCPYSGRLY